ncbi:phosphate acyltransferase PlsX [Acetobacteraceae bacterium]|nr:phosphate acyltransferase PlsX [Acetobacteraceae bacterium]
MKDSEGEFQKQGDLSSVVESPKSPPYTLAVDAMGGDRGADIVFAALDKTADRHPWVKILLVGDGPSLQRGLLRHSKAAKICDIRHAPMVIPMDMKPTKALRVQGSSMQIAMKAVAQGEAAGVVSAGNSGAMLALAKIIIKVLPGISRPALVAVQPSARGDVVMLDLGANLACDARNLVEFAIMGEAFSRAMLDIREPTIGLLNVGSEDVKGDERLHEAAAALRNGPLASRFVGFVEGHDITAGHTDVIVTDGFTGNIALKMGEGALKLAYGLLRAVFSSSVFTKLGYLLARRGLDRMKDWIDPRRYNGALLIGLNGIVVKSHGGADVESFAAAVDVAVDAVAFDMNDHIKKRLAESQEAFSAKS